MRKHFQSFISPNVYKAKFDIEIKELGLRHNLRKSSRFPNWSLLS